MNQDYRKCSICNGKHLPVEFLCTNNECTHRRLMCRICKKNNHDTHNTIMIDHQWNHHNAAVNKFDKYYQAIDKNWDEVNQKFKNHAKTWKQILGSQVSDIQIDTKQKNINKMNTEQVEAYARAINNKVIQPYKKRNALLSTIHKIVKTLKQSVQIICTQVQDSFFDLYSEVQAISVRKIYEEQLVRVPQEQNKIFSSLNSKNSELQNQNQTDFLKKIVLSDDTKSINQVLSSLSSYHNLQEVVLQSQKLAKNQYIQEILKRVPNLKSLSFNCNNDFDDVTLSKLMEIKPNLRRLYCCYNFSQYLSHFDQALSFKITPNVYRYYGLTQYMTKSLLRNFHNLENMWLGNQVSKQEFDLTDDLSKIKDITLGHLMIKNRNPNKLLLVKLGYLRHLETVTFISLNIAEEQCSSIWTGNHSLTTVCFLHCQGITDITLKYLEDNLNHLKHLAIYDNYQASGIPIWNMKNLTTLILSNCPKINQQAANNISKLDKLQHLNLNSNADWINHSIIEKIAELKLLRVLNLSWCNLANQDIQSLSTLKRLEALYLGGSQAEGSKIAKLVPQLKCLQKLSLIGLHGNDGRGLLRNRDLTQIIDRTSLAHLDISYCQQITSEIVENLLQLKVIRLHGTGIKDEGIRKLKASKIKVIDFI